MHMDKFVNVSLLSVIRDGERLTKDEIKQRYFPPEVPGVIQGCVATFEQELQDLIDEGYVKKDGMYYTCNGRVR